MKTLVIYYSFGGYTKKWAEKLAAEVSGELCEVKEAKKRGIFSAFFSGCPAAMNRKASEIAPIGVNLGDYDRIWIGAPIWASHPAPAFNAIAAALPSGREVGLFFTSGGGGSQKSGEGTKKLVEAKGCKIIGYRDISQEKK